MGKLISKLRRMFSEAEPTNQSPANKNAQDDPGEAALAPLGIKVGDKVVVGGVKVSFGMKYNYVIVLPT